MPEESVESVESIPTKQKRVPTEAQLNALKLAREKAAEKRKELGNITKKEKEITKEAKDKLLNERLEKIKTLEKVSKEEPKKKKVPKKVVSSSSESSSSNSDSDSSIETKVVRRKPKPRTKRIIEKIEKKSNEQLSTDVA